MAPRFCTICDKEVDTGTVLSTGRRLHPECLASLARQEEAARIAVDDLDAALVRERTIAKNQQSILYRIASLFQTGSHEEHDVGNRIDALIFKLRTATEEYRRITSALTSIYTRLPDYPPDWMDRRTVVLDRDRHMCCKCSARSQLHVHHKVSLSAGGDNSLGNLETLCEGCHSAAHGGVRFNYEALATRTSQKINEGIPINRPKSAGARKPPLDHYRQFRSPSALPSTRSPLQKTLRRNKGDSSEVHGKKKKRDSKSQSQQVVAYPALEGKLKSVEKAISQGKNVTFRYRKPTDTKFVERTVKPYEIIRVEKVRRPGTTLCLSGFCYLRNADRTFAFTRMRDLEVI